MIGWLLAYRRVLAPVAAILAAGWYYGHTRYEAGQRAVQALWDADKAVAAQTVIERARQNEQKRLADEAVARKVQDDLQDRITAGDARNRDLARRLHDYEARRCGGTVPGAAGAAAGTDAAGRESGSDQGIGAAVAAVTEACRHDAERLTGWQEWWRGVSSW